MIIPKALADAPRIQQTIQRVAKSFTRDVVAIYYEIGFDSMGSPSIFFKIVLSDAAAKRPRLRELSQRLALALMNEIGTDEHGIHAYFNFRSQSEVNQMNDPAWAS